ncbi:MAG TPA: hypothetical protein VMA95_07785, partial [Streptosporangiaceae bacterium]|nr:hypothetical protein [Streptosporangiaceae bacterium]
MCAMELPTADTERPRQSGELHPPRSSATTEPVNRPPDARTTDAAGPPPSIRERERQRWVERLEKKENPPTIRAELKEKLEHLEPGHPSSPWEEDGTPKPPVPRLSDHERPVPPLSDADYKTHVDDVVRRLGDAAAAKPPVGLEHSIDGKGQ